jgi:hypothetical protein
MHGELDPFGRIMATQTATPDVEKSAFDLFKRNGSTGGAQLLAWTQAHGLAEQAERDGNSALAGHWHSVAARLNGDDYKNYQPVGPGAKPSLLNAAPIAAGVGAGAYAAGGNQDQANASPGSAIGRAVARAAYLVRPSDAAGSQADGVDYGQLAKSLMGGAKGAASWAINNPLDAAEIPARVATGVAQDAWDAGKSALGGNLLPAAEFADPTNLLSVLHGLVSADAPRAGPTDLRSLKSQDQAAVRKRLSEALTLDPTGQTLLNSVFGHSGEEDNRTRR